MRERTYTGTIEEIEQMRLEEAHEKQIIAAFMEIEGIDIITEEEMTDLFGDTYFHFNLYYIGPAYFSGCEHIFISDYEQHLLNNGYDPIACDFLDERNRTDYLIIPIVDSIPLWDIVDEDWSTLSYTWEEMIESDISDYYDALWLDIPIIPNWRIYSDEMRHTLMRVYYSFEGL